jgi:hypothetical protein
MQAQTFDCRSAGLPRKIAELLDAHASRASS